MQRAKKQYHSLTVLVNGFLKLPLPSPIGNLLTSKRRVPRRIAKAFLKVQEEFSSFDAYIRGFVDGKPIQNQWKSMSELPAKTALSEEISKDLKNRGFNFVGPTIVYASMQAMGMVNDHTVDCFRCHEISAMT